MRITEQIIRLLSTEEPLKVCLEKLATVYLEATADIDINAFMKDAKIALSEEQLERVQASKDDMYEALTSSLQDAMDTGEIPNANARLISILFVAMLAASNSTNRSAGDEALPLDKLVADTMNLFWYGLFNQSN